MTYLLALLIFLLITTVVWFGAVAAYQWLLGGPDLRRSPDFVGVSCFSIPLVAVLSTIPYPTGAALALLCWAWAAWGLLGLPWHRGGVLFFLLAALSYLSRLALLGVLSD